MLYEISLHSSAYRHVSSLVGIFSRDAFSRRLCDASWGSRSFGTKNNDPLELFVFVSFCESLSYLSLRPIHCAEAVSSFMIEAGTPSMKADTVSEALLEAGKRWGQGVFEHIRARDAQTRQLFASHCVV
jgi:hypothetical protein